MKVAVDLTKGEAKFKKLWKGTFNWHGQVIILYRYATLRVIAETVLIRALAQKLRVAPGYVNMYFTQHADGWKVEEETNVSKA